MRYEGLSVINSDARETQEFLRMNGGEHGGGLSITNGTAELLSVANNPKYSASGDGHGASTRRDLQQRTTCKDGSTWSEACFTPKEIEAA